jgi:penicillin-binding protein 1A
MSGVRAFFRAVVLFLMCSAAVPMMVTATILLTFLFAPLPATIPQPKELAASRVSTVLDGNGEQIGVFREFEQNIPVLKEDIPEHLKQAVVSAEDQGFYSHGGVDIRGSARALLADLRNQGLVQGGSTITQQYVKNAYTGTDRTVVRKVREAILASQLDRQFEKDDILFKYLSTIYLGNGAYGVGAASETYFRKPVSQLSLSEAALLAGLIPAPSRYEPRGNPQLAESKRAIVLAKMLEQGRITQQQYDEAAPQKVWLASQGAPKGPATVVHPPQQQNSKFPFFVDYVGRYLIAKYGPAKVFKGGLRIQTTLDPDVQAAAEKTVAEQLKGTKAPLEMSLVAVEPPTGYVKALVGGRDFGASTVNLALGGCPRMPRDPKIKVEVRASCWDGESVGGGGGGRQPGSAFKPYVLATAFAKGYSPNKVYKAPAVFHIPNCRETKPGSCDISNNEGEGSGSATLRQATVKSINTVYAQVVRDVGCKETAEMAKKLGLESAWYSPQFHTCSGNYALGVIDVSPLNMASAYGVFANRGVRVAPTPVLKVIDGDGKVLEDNSKPKGEQVIEQVVADNVTDVLRGVITGGTGTRANIGRPAAGKTGTGQNYTNAYFTGYTPTLSTAVWMGYTNNQSTPLLRIKGVSRVFGGTIPAATWHDFMAAALKDVPVTDFSEPAPIKPLADALDRQARDGFDPGTKREISGTDGGGPYIVQPPAPTATPPSTTTTTEPNGGGGGGGGGGGTTTTSTTLLPDQGNGGTSPDAQPAPDP